MARALAEDGCCQTSSFRRTRAVIEHMCSQPRDGRDAASIVFDLPGYDVVDAVDLPLGGRRVVVQARARDRKSVVQGENQLSPVRGLADRGAREWAGEQSRAGGRVQCW